MRDASVTAESRPDRRGIPVTRRVALVSIVFAGVVVTAEAAGLLGFWIVEGHPLPWRSLQRERRAVLDRDESVPGRSRPSAEVLHPYLGYVRNPERGDGASEFGYSSSNPVFTRRAPGRRIVAVTGGSVAHNLLREAGSILSERLEAAPGFEGRDVVLVDLAMGGYKQPQQLMALNYFLALGFEFDVVINVDGFNEVALHPAENGRKGVFPVYPRGWYARLGELPDARSRELRGKIAHVDARIATLARTFSSGPLRYSITANLVWRAWNERLFRARWDSTDALRRHRPPETPYVATGPRVDFGENGAVYEHLVAVWRRCSLQMDRLCRANGIRYHHFLQPNQYVEGSKPLTEEERATAWRADHPYRAGARRGYGLLVRAGEELLEAGVRYVDLSGIFSSETRTVYADDCCHYNALGNEILARRIAREVVTDRAP